MKTLQIQNGDFVIGSGGFALIEGVQKVYQDLSILVREPLGVDRFHPQWGTILDEYIGEVINADVPADIKNEIRRVVQNYMVLQSSQIAADVSMGRRPRFRPEEVIIGIDSINVQQRNDRLNVKVSVRTESGESLDIVRTVGF